MRLRIEWLLIVPNDSDRLLSWEADSSRENFLPFLETRGFRLARCEPIFRDPDLRELIGIDDHFLLFQRGQPAQRRRATTSDLRVPLSALQPHHLRCCVQETPIIEIACSADARYLPHVSAMLHSVLTQTPQRPLRVWLMHGRDLPEQGRDRVRDVVGATGAQLEFLRVPDDMVEGFPTQRFHYSCWYRMLLPELLPALDRVLYLDCDLIATDDLEPLWSTDLGDRVFGAAINPLFTPMYGTVRHELGLEDFRDYLNSGVLLMNLVRMREENLIARLREYAAAHPKNNCPEQDALSVLMRGRWLSLHPRWNAQAALYALRASRQLHPKSVVKEALRDPAVVHFNGPFKPWEYLCKHPLRHLYFEHLRATPWPVQPLLRSSLGYRLIRPLNLNMQYWVLMHVRPHLRPLWIRARRRFAA